MVWNNELFLLLNAPAAPDALVLALVRALARSPLVIAPVLLAWLWVRKPGPTRAGLLASALAVGIGKLVALGLGLLWFEPRPFMDGIGHNFLAHAANNGFPSDHTTLTMALGAALLLTGAARAVGGAVCLLALAVGWARVWLGVHFPVDVLVGIPAGYVAGWLAARAEPALARLVLPPCERLYAAILDALRLPRAVFPRQPR